MLYIMPRYITKNEKIEDLKRTVEYLRRERNSMLEYLEKLGLSEDELIKARGYEPVYLGPDEGYSVQGEID